MEEEQAKDPTDPIIKFYKERHERSKKVLDSDSWTQEVYESTRKSYLTKEERFGNWKPEEKETTEQYVPALTYALFSVLIMTLFYTSELENHKVKKFWDGLFK